MTLADFTEMAKNYSETTHSAELFGAFRVLSEFHNAILDDDFAPFPNDDGYFSNLRIQQNANFKAYVRGVIVMSALAIIANNPVYTLATPDNKILMEETERAGHLYHTYRAFTSLEAAKAYIEEMKSEGGEDMAKLMESLKIFRVPFMAVSYIGMSLYKNETLEPLEPMYKIGEVMEDGKLGFYSILGRFYHNILPTMALGAVDTEAAEAVMFGSENFVPEKPEEEAECESEYCDGGDPYPNAEEEAEAMSVLKRALCDGKECLVEDDEDIDWNGIAALLAEE